MTLTDSSNRLSRIQTNWTQLFETRDSDPAAALNVWRDMLLQYSGAVVRYLAAAVKDDHVADDLAQEFAVRFLRGDFHAADPQRGRFRDFLKQALRNLVSDHFRRQKTERRTLEQAGRSATSANEPELDFEQSWTDELLARTWERLREHQLSSGSSYFDVLTLRAEYPTDSIEQLLARYSNSESQSAATFRQTLHRARRQFGEFLRHEVRRTLRDDTDIALEQELADLGLLKFGI